MSGTALDHRLVRDYLRELDAAMRGLPAAQARELKEQITAHLDDALRPDAGDQEVAATLSRLGSPADLAAEAGAASGSSGPRFALSSPRMRWRLAAVIAVPAAIAAVLGALQISSDVSNAVASGRDQHLARLDAAVVTLTQDLEDERDLSAAYVAREQAGAGPVTLADARGPPARRPAPCGRTRPVSVSARGTRGATVQDLHALLKSTDLTDRGRIRGRSRLGRLGVEGHPGLHLAPSSRPRTRSAPRSAAVPATRFAGHRHRPRRAARARERAVGAAGRLVRRAELAAQDIRAGATGPSDPGRRIQAADQSDFNASANETEQENLNNTVSGPWQRARQPSRKRWRSR